MKAKNAKAAGSSKAMTQGAMVKYIDGLKWEDWELLAGVQPLIQDSWVFLDDRKEWWWWGGGGGGGGGGRWGQWRLSGGGWWWRWKSWQWIIPIASKL